MADYNPSQAPAQTPALPTFQFGQTGGLSIDPASVFEALKRSAGVSLTNTALPYMQQTLSSQGQFLAPAVQAIQKGGEQAAASAQSDAMKRGMTGSDIEAAGMVGARSTAQEQVAQLIGQAGLQQAQTMAQATMEAMGFDIKQNQELFSGLAQAIGQELASQRSMDMFREQLEQALLIARENNDAAMESAIINAIGQIGGKVAGAATAGLMAPSPSP